MYLLYLFARDGVIVELYCILLFFFFLALLASVIYMLVNSFDTYFSF